MTASQKCLVTGAAGFIGSHLVDRLLDQGATVLGLDNLKLGRHANLAKALEHPRFKFVEQDVNDVAGVRRLVVAESKSAPFEVAWHLAANSDIRAGVADPEVDLRDTFLTTHNLLKVLREQRIGQLAFASTSAIYGLHPGRLHEELGPLFPISNYGAMKLASEAAISAAREAFLERAWIFRFPNVVGSRSTHGVIYDFAQKLKKTPGELEVLGDGSQEKPYFHVEDLVEALNRLLGTKLTATHRHGRQRDDRALHRRGRRAPPVSRRPHSLHWRQEGLGRRRAAVQLFDRKIAEAWLDSAVDLESGRGPGG